MAEIKFTDPAVAAKYATDQTEDKIHHIPGGTTRKGWRGKLSEIPLAVADFQISKKQQNLLKLKVETPAAKPEGKKKAEEPA